MNGVDGSRREFLRFGGLLRRLRARTDEPSPTARTGPDPAGTPFVGAEPPPPWARRDEPSPPARRKTRFAQIRRPACLAHGGTACSVCVERCPLPAVVTLDAGRPRIDADGCDGCGACVDACPSPVPAIVLIPYIDGGSA